MGRVVRRRDRRRIWRVVPLLLHMIHSMQFCLGNDEPIESVRVQRQFSAPETVNTVNQVGLPSAISSRILQTTPIELDGIRVQLIVDNGVIERSSVVTVVSDWMKAGFLEQLNATDYGFTPYAPLENVELVTPSSSGLKNFTTYDLRVPSVLLWFATDDDTRTTIVPIEELTRIQRELLENDESLLAAFQNSDSDGLGDAVQQVSIAPLASPAPSTSASPSVTPTDGPTASAPPSQQPSSSSSPSALPSGMPSVSLSPSSPPSIDPSLMPSVSFKPTASQSPSMAPSQQPSASPSSSFAPSTLPSQHPSDIPSAIPSVLPSFEPSHSFMPSTSPSISSMPSISDAPSGVPSAAPSTSVPPSANPTTDPSTPPSNIPSVLPSFMPSPVPTISKEETVEEPYITMILDGVQNDLTEKQQEDWNDVTSAFVQDFWNNQLEKSPIFVQKVVTEFLSQERIPQERRLEEEEEEKDSRNDPLHLEIAYKQTIDFAYTTVLSGPIDSDNIFLLPFQVNSLPYTNILVNITDNPTQIFWIDSAITQPPTMAPTRRDESSKDRNIIIIVVVVVMSSLIIAAVYIVYLLRKENQAPARAPTQADEISFTHADDDNVPIPVIQPIHFRNNNHAAAESGSDSASPRKIRRMGSEESSNAQDNLEGMVIRGSASDTDAEPYAMLDPQRSHDEYDEEEDARDAFVQHMSNFQLKIEDLED